MIQFDLPLRQATQRKSERQFGTESFRQRYSQVAELQENEVEATYQQLTDRAVDTIYSAWLIAGKPMSVVARFSLRSMGDDVENVIFGG